MEDSIKKQHSSMANFINAWTIGKLNGIERNIKMMKQIMQRGDMSDMHIKEMLDMEIQIYLMDLEQLNIALEQDQTLEFLFDDSPFILEELKHCREALHAKVEKSLSIAKNSDSEMVFQLFGKSKEEMDKILREVEFIVKKGDSN